MPRSVTNRHPDEAILAQLAAGRPEDDAARAARAHVDGGCRLCGRRLSGLSRLVSAVRETEEFERVLSVSTEPLPFEPRRPSRLDMAKVLLESEAIVPRVLEAARLGGEALAVALAELPRSDARGLVLAHSCQKAPALVFESPEAALGLARAVAAEAESLPEASSGSAVTRELVLAEAKLLESQALLALGRAREAQEAAGQARPLFSAAGDAGFADALCDYFEGSAMSWAKDYTGSERLLKKALAVFAEFGQDHLSGRAEGALGLVYTQRGDHERALAYFGLALEHLDEERDANAYASLLNNRAATLKQMGRLDEARIAYARALKAARKLGASLIQHRIRFGLAEIDARRGVYARALRSFLDLAGAARESGLGGDELIERLYAAECLGRLGRLQEMTGFVLELQREAKAGLFGMSEALDDLFCCMQQGEMDAGDVEHVRRFVQDQEMGLVRPYERLRLVG
ncbi:MAG TPA: tetratricopeptide repeat protein [Thermoanaerobaculia bacterium]|nr:tetratricopeptide repeat protein [Thermoanaerobaculia bacterium]